MDSKEAQQEPVQRYSPDGEGGMEVDSLGAWMKFTSPPPQRTRVWLTDKEIVTLFNKTLDGKPLDVNSMTNFARSIEAKLNEKNT